MSASFTNEFAPIPYAFVNLFKENKYLTDREREVASLIASGISNKDAADRLNITEKTVKFHLTNVYKKLKIKSRSQLIIAVIQYRATSFKAEVGA